MARMTLQKLAFVTSVTLLTSACSMLDKSDDYQLSRSNDTQLVVPQGSVAAQDSLVIPHESKISDITEITEFVIPEIPDSYEPLAHLPVSWEGDLMWIETPLNQDAAKVVVKNFLASLYGEGNPIDVSTDDEIISVPVGDKDQNTLLKLYYNVTRLYPDRVVYRFPIKSGVTGTKIGFQRRIISTDQNKVETFSDWIRPDASDEDYVVALQLISAISRESLDSVKVSDKSSDAKSPAIWLSNNGQFVLNVSDDADQAKIAELIEKSDLYLISRNPLELAFVTEGEITKVGDIKPVTLPPTTDGGKEIVLLNVRYRNLNGVDWQKRVYPVDLVQRTEGLFVEVDASAADYPDVVSYRIMSALIK